MYFYILYPHGLSYQKEIITILKTNFKIIKILDLNIKNRDLNEFFFNYLYKNENKHHIKNKLQYINSILSQNNFKMKIILLNDDNEVFFNDRGTRKNIKIENIKREIRNKFNPKFDNSNRQIFPLEKGVSHNHIIHSNDVPEEYQIIKNIIIRYKKYNIFKVDNYHHKNEFFLRYYINNYHNSVDNIRNADIILSASKFLFKTETFPDKKFIFGPHFGKNKINEMRKINNMNNNNIYIQPSMPSVKLWTDELKYTTTPVKAIPFGVDTDKFKPDTDIVNKNEVMLYYKNRNPGELNFIEKILNERKINYKLFSYTRRYNEDDYMNHLKKSKYGIWLGSHESQGFALEEALSCNVPLLVWNVTLRKQEWSMREVYKNIKSNVTTIPYWDKRCGEFFYNQNEFESKFDEFLSKLDTYQPRQFILENLSLEKCAEKWNKLIYDIL